MENKEHAVISANHNFYKAFSLADYNAMALIWSARDEISVIHPGWNVLHGRKIVLSSWSTILKDLDRINIISAGEKVYFAGEVAYVICTEIMQDNELIATNVFVDEAGDWKLIHHHAGPVNLPQKGREVTH